jgi:hypothetical protein
MVIRRQECFVLISSVAVALALSAALTGFEYDAVCLQDSDSGFAVRDSSRALSVENAAPAAESEAIETVPGGAGGASTGEAVSIGAELTAEGPEETKPAGHGEEGTKTTSADTTAHRSPPDSVVAYYFHRTFRCDKCLLMEACIRDAIAQNYADALIKGTLRWHTLDYEQPEHADSAVKYQLDGPALVLSHWAGGREVSWARMDELWDLVDDPGAMIDSLEVQLGDCLMGKCIHGELFVPDTSGVTEPAPSEPRSTETQGRIDDKR